MLKNHNGDVIELKYGAHGNPIVPIDYDLVTEVTRMSMDMVAGLDPEDGKGARMVLLRELPVEWDLMDRLVKGLFLVNYGSVYYPKWDYMYAHQPARALFDSVHRLVSITIDPDDKRTRRGQATWRALLDVMGTHMEYPKVGLFSAEEHLIEGRRSAGELIPLGYWGGPTREAHFKTLRDIAIKHA